MAAARSSNAKAPGRLAGEGLVAWLGTLLLGSVLIVAGFGTGLVLGVSSEEPELVWGHLAARTQDVPWHVIEDDPVTAPSAVAALAAEEAGAAESLPDVAAAPPRTAGFAVQVGAFSSDAAAREVSEDLRGKGYPGYVVASAGARDGRWRVRVGPYPTRDEADESAARLKAEEMLPTWVLSEAE